MPARVVRARSRRSVRRAGIARAAESKMAAQGVRWQGPSDIARPRLLMQVARDIVRWAAKVLRNGGIGSNKAFERTRDRAWRNGWLVGREPLNAGVRQHHRSLHGILPSPVWQDACPL